MQTSFRFNDIVLVFVVIASMAAAIIYPDFGSRFQMFPVYCLMINFFLSYLSIDLADVWQALKGHSGQILAFTVMKLTILPVIMYFVFHFIAPDYALSALLLTGVSAGVVSPMISNMVRGNSSLVLVVVVITSALVPFTLPALIKAVAAKEVVISFLPMLKMLATVIFVPIAIVEFIRYLIPKLVAPILKIQFPVSLLMFALINLGVFYRYAPFFKKEPSVIIMAVVVVFVLAAVYCAVGIFFFRKGPLENQLAGAVMLGNINNVLVIVFSSSFFGPVEPLVAAMYMIPFFVIVIPLRYFRHRKTRII
ncbi:MAG: bile acid:sodium symporter [Deltaproteobacteria bacterium HGW-Deltaproteobacteria-1]|jgi:BASS family bile acid:Na+ symporter|nr:MAG: bile acid:sodium symporter [Deltaproteobacteria bacterium HGW-Deltaproteobacteria-5]PKN82857.1 MAG: bile acid:sodium symporter [Deltaproteobacteria bacterium HGW-Deltaproteobacteria-1]